MLVNMISNRIYGAMIQGWSLVGARTMKLIHGEKTLCPMFRVARQHDQEKKLQRS